MQRLAIISTHPIQYNAPWFAMLAQRKKIDLKVFYTWPQAIDGYDDPDFGTKIKWDIPVLEGYNYQFVENISKDPTSKNWKGIDNPTLIEEVKKYNPDAILIFGWKFKSHFALMRYFKGKVPVWFRGDSTLLDYDIQTLCSVFRKQSSIGIKQAAFGYWPLAISSFAKFKLRTLILTLVYRYIDKALYVGTNSKAYFKKHGLKEKQLVLAPHAIENERFFDSEEKRYEEKACKWRKELGIGEADKVILFAGKLESKKNPLLLLKAFQNISQQLAVSSWQSTSNSQLLSYSTPQLLNPSTIKLLNSSTPKLLNSSTPKLLNSSTIKLLNSSTIKLKTHPSQLTSHNSPLKIHLLFVGSGPLKEQLQKESQNNANIHFLPFQNQSMMPIVYRLGDILCLPSQGPEETWGLVVNEALASGRPVLTSNKVGCSADLINPEVGRIFESNNQHDLQNKLHELLTQSISKETCQKHISKWSFEGICNSVEKEILD